MFISTLLRAITNLFFALKAIMCSLQRTFGPLDVNSPDTMEKHDFELEILR